MQDAGAGDGGEEDDGAAVSCSDHVATAGLGNEERAGQINIQEGTKHGGVVGFGFDVGAEGR